MATKRWPGGQLALQQLQRAHQVARLHQRMRRGRRARQRHDDEEVLGVELVGTKFNRASHASMIANLI
jgi:hypothetical protein